jgi:AcrR family transcriptional regulator
MIFRPEEVEKLFKNRMFLAKQESSLNSNSMARPAGGVREKILEAAIHLLREYGLKKLAQPQVAKAAGIPQGHLTYYFPKRSDLISAVATRFVESMGKDLEAFLRERDPNESANVREQLMAFVIKVAQDRERTRMMLGLIVESESDPVLRQSLLNNTLRVRLVLANSIGLPPEDPDVSVALAAFWGLGIQHLIMSEQRTDEETYELFNRLPFWFQAVRKHRQQEQQPQAQATPLSLPNTKESKLTTASEAHADRTSPIPPESPTARSRTIDPILKPILSTGYLDCQQQRTQYAG